MSIRTVLTEKELAIVKEYRAERGLPNNVIALRLLVQDYAQLRRQKWMIDQWQAEHPPTQGDPQ